MKIASIIGYLLVTFSLSVSSVQSESIEQKQLLSQQTKPFQNCELGNWIAQIGSLSESTIVGTWKKAYHPSLKGVYEVDSGYPD